MKINKPLSCRPRVTGFGALHAVSQFNFLAFHFLCLILQLKPVSVSRQPGVTGMVISNSHNFFVKLLDFYF